jgi:hypothetical protein
MTFRAAAVIACLLATACGDDAPTPPRIAALRITPEAGVLPGEKLTASVDVIDEDGDLAGGSAEIGMLREGDDEGDLFKVPLAAEDSVTRATIVLDIRLPNGTIPDRYDLAVVILDAATRRSNPLVAPLDVLAP